MGTAGTAQGHWAQRAGVKGEGTCATRSTASPSSKSGISSTSPSSRCLSLLSLMTISSSSTVIIESFLFAELSVLIHPPPVAAGSSRRRRGLATASSKAASVAGASSGLRSRLLRPPVSFAAAPVGDLAIGESSSFSMKDLLLSICLSRCLGVEKRQGERFEKSAGGYYCAGTVSFCSNLERTK